MITPDEVFVSLGTSLTAIMRPKYEMMKKSLQGEQKPDWFIFVKEPQIFVNHHNGLSEVAHDPLSVVVLHALAPGLHGGSGLPLNVVLLLILDSGVNITPEI